MKHGSLFSGIGGFDLASEWMGWENVFHCEWNEFGKKVLKHYWPDSESFHDITKTDFTKYENKIDILTGGFPCQPYSMAGKRLGKDDDRHLWPEMLRAIREIKPRWIVGENVLGIVNWNEGLVFDEVQSDLEGEGYEVQPYILPAVSVGAPHRRDRVWFVAYSNGSKQANNGRANNEEKGEIWGNEKSNVLGELLSDGNASNTNSQRLQCERESTRMGWERLGKYNAQVNKSNFQNFPTEYPICSGNDGISQRLDGVTFSKWRAESIKGYGNAVVPQVVYQIFKTIEAYENESN
jgi:DNA (cytosine-5)-methyltransferase 1